MSSGPGVELRKLFDAARAEGRALLLPYMTAGLPNPADSLRMFEAMAAAGADGFEVGIPYSDPLMDGPTIHQAGLDALAAGTTLGTALDLLAAVRHETGKPTMVMTYVNPVLSLGVDAFAERVAAAGASAVILADLPAEEAPVFQQAFERAGVGMVLFVAPTTGDARLAEVAASSPVFLYGVAELSVTGERSTTTSRAIGLAGRVRAVTNIPLVLGVGISTPEHARRAAAVADGVIVGSALVRRVLDAASAEQAAADLGRAVADLAAAVRDPASEPAH